MTRKLNRAASPTLTRLAQAWALCAVALTAWPLAASGAQIIRPSADGTLADGGVYGAFDGIADNWDWTFNESSYEGAITLSSPPGSSAIEQRVVWEYNLSAVTLAPPLRATLSFALRGAPVFPMPDAVIQVFSYPADLVENSGDFAGSPAGLQGSIVVPAFQASTVHNLDVSGAVNQALAGNRKVAFRFQAASAGGPTNAQAFFDASDSDMDTKPYLSIETGSAGVPAALLIAAVSRTPNASAPGSFCDLPLMAGRKSEPRAAGITEVRLGFDITPGSPTGAGVTLEQATCAAPGFVPYAGASVVSGVLAANELVLSFSPALENARTYRILIGPSITSTAGQTVEIRGLVGDVNHTGQVDGNDRSVIVGVWTGAGFSCETDLNGNGATNSNDRSVVVGAWTGPENCAP